MCTNYTASVCAAVTGFEEVLRGTLFKHRSPNPHAAHSTPSIRRARLRFCPRSNKMTDQNVPLGPARFGILGARRPQLFRPQPNEYSQREYLAGQVAALTRQVTLLFTENVLLRSCITSGSHGTFPLTSLDTTSWDQGLPSVDHSGDVVNQGLQGSYLVANLPVPESALDGLYVTPALARAAVSLLALLPRHSVPHTLPASITTLQACAAGQGPPLQPPAWVQPPQLLGYRDTPSYPSFQPAAQPVVSRFPTAPHAIASTPCDTRALHDMVAGMVAAGVAQAVGTQRADNSHQQPCRSDSAYRPQQQQPDNAFRQRQLDAQQRSARYSQQRSTRGHQGHQGYHGHSRQGLRHNSPPAHDRYQPDNRGHQHDLHQASPSADDRHQPDRPPSKRVKSRVSSQQHQDQQQPGAPMADASS